MITKEEIIDKAHKIHGDKYDYSKVENVQNLACKIKIICPVHGEFEQTVHNHLQGKCCRKCYEDSRFDIRKITREKFIELATKTHDDINRYDFSNLPERFDLNNSQKVIKIGCKEHGVFNIRYKNFLKGGKCPVCEGLKKSNKEKMEELITLHPNLDFSETDLSNMGNDYKIKVICPEHGVKYVRYYNLLNGQGACKECGDRITKEKERMSQETFLDKAKIVHGDKYDLSKVKYVNMKTKIEVICPTHGSFFVLPDNFVSKRSGCPICKNNHIEDEISMMLQENNIEYIPQKPFTWSENQRLDFYLPKYNIGIECQGIQHFYPRTFQNDTSNGDEMLKRNIKMDIKKHNNCKSQIKLIYIITPHIKKEEIVNKEKFGFIYENENTFTDKTEILKYILDCITEDV